MNVDNMSVDHLVTQSNNLIEARYYEPLTSRQQKIVLSIVSMIQPDDENFKTYEIRVRDFHEMLGLEGEPKYTELRAITEKIFKKTLGIKRENGRYLQVGWFSSIEYFENEGRMEFSFDPKLKPYLLNLKKAFTSYRLSNILSLKSAYAIRLYELMKKWQYLGKWECPIDNLKEKLGIEESKYKQYGHFKSRVINPSINELNNKTDIQVSYKEIRKGRKVVKIEFTIRHHKEREIRVESLKKDSFDKSLFNKLNNLLKGSELSVSGFNQIVKIAKTIYNKDEYIEQLELLARLIEKKRPKNPVGLMIFIMKDKLQLAEQGLDPRIKEEQIVTEVLPEWFKKESKLQNETRDFKKEKEELEKSLKALSSNF